MSAIRTFLAVSLLLALACGLVVGMQSMETPLQALSAAQDGDSAFSFGETGNFNGLVDAYLGNYATGKDVNPGYNPLNITKAAREIPPRETTGKPMLKVGSIHMMDSAFNQRNTTLVTLNQS